MSNIRKETVLNKSVFDYILMCIADRDIAPLNELGMSCLDIQKLQELYAIDLISLACSRANFIKVKIDRTRFYNLLNAISKERAQQQQIIDLIRLGAPQTMLKELFAISQSEYTALRKSLNLSDGIGRTANVSEQDASLVYMQFKELNTTVDKLSIEQWRNLLSKSNMNLRELWNTLKNI